MEKCYKAVFKAVFFDVDGVLLDSLPTHLQFCQDMSNKLQLGLQIPTPPAFQAMVAAGAGANPMSKFLETVGFRDDALAQALEAYERDFAQQYKPDIFPCIPELLEHLKRGNVPLGLVTSNICANVESALGAELMAMFNPNLTFYGKRKAEALVLGAQWLKVQPEDCVFVGDVPSDAAAAQEVNTRFLGVSYGWSDLRGNFEVAPDPCDLGKALDHAAEIPLPFDSERHRLYTVHELWNGYDPDLGKNTSLDARIYRYFKNRNKYSPRLDELRAQRMHDAGIEDAIDELLGVDYRSFPTHLKPVMILGSHRALRRDPWYTRVAHLTWELSRAGYFVATGGGPGLMEAANLGAYMAANYSKDQLNEALEILRHSSEPATGDARKQYEMPDYWELAQQVVKKFSAGGPSLGVPTWFYGHEGANAFASYVAKFLSNGLRESKMTSIGTFGAIFAPGGPGTSQEVFTDGAENTYHSFQWLSPMVFFNDPNDALVPKMLEILRKQTNDDYRAQDMYLHTDDTARIVKFLQDRPPQFRERH